MSLILPSNEECWHRIIGAGDSDARTLFRNLKAFSAWRNLLENEEDFERRLPGQFHELFWELYLPAAFARFGIDVERGDGKQLEPDFHFQSGDLRVFVEAVACSEPTKESNRVHPPVEDSDFENGFAPEAQIMQRLSQAIDSKIKAVGRCDALSVMSKHGKYAVVIAVNGNRALNGHPHDDVPISIPFIVRTVFGAADQWIKSNGSLVWRLAGQLRGGSGNFPFAHFAQVNWPVKDQAPISIANIAGVLFSKAGAWHTALKPGDDFLFVRNPFGPDLTRVFDWCSRGVWMRDGNQIRLLNPISQTAKIAG